MVARFIRAKSDSTLLKRQRVSRLEGRGCIHSGQGVTETKRESAAHCSPHGVVNLMGTLRVGEKRK